MSLRDPHRRGTLALFDRLAGLVGGHPAATVVRALVARDVPETGGLAFKYDLYGAPEGWGVTINERWETGGSLLRALAPAAKAWGHDLAPARALHRELGGRAEVTVSFGLDAASPIPRLKVYFQEARWGDGVATSTAIRTGAAGLGCPVPEWLPDRPAGVLCQTLRADGPVGLKAYYGGRTAHDAAGGATDEGRMLAIRMEELCPSPGWHYLTVRMDPGHRIGVAINKIYNPVRLRAGDDAARAAAWAEVDALLAAVGRPDHPLRRAAEHPDLVVVPTATALQDEGRSADLYAAAWSVGA